MFQKLFYPRQALLVSSAHNGRMNLTATNWVTPISISPPMIAVSLPNTGLTLKLVSRSKEFVVAVPHEGIKDALLLCLAASGRHIDKFAESGLTAKKADTVSAPLISEALANVECKVNSIQSCGTNSLVTGEVFKTHFPEEDTNLHKLVFDNGERDLFAFELLSLQKLQGSQ